MKTFISILIVIQMWQCCYAPPVTKNEKEHLEESDSDPMSVIHYNRYLKQVVNALESDLGFKKKLEEASEDDIKSGKIAHELDFVSHHVRTKLDELKRVELERLLDIKHKLTVQGIDGNEIDEPLHGHVDHANKHTFEIDDLKKLIAKTTADLAEADRLRREEFKAYELQKEFEKQDKLNQTNGAEEREKLEKQYKEMEEKHKKHEPLHQPGHKAQLEEVWQEQDHMQQKFDPVAFFMLHDLDSNNFWDQNEVKALFIKELNKIYAAGVPEDDIRERAEEMERMRESVFKEMDRDKDGLISRKEFLDQTHQTEFEQDHGWKGIDEQEHPYSDEELQEYIRQQQIHRPQGYHVPPGGQHPPGGYHPNQIPQGYAPPQQPGQYYQGQQPPQYQPPQYQQAPNQPPPQYYQQGQPPLQYQQPGQPQAFNQPPPAPGQYQQHLPPQVPNQSPPPGQQNQQPVQLQVPNQPPPPPASLNQQPVQPQVPNQPPPPPGQQYQQAQPSSSQGQQYQQQQQVNQLPPQNQPSPQVNPHQAGQPVQAP